MLVLSGATAGETIGGNVPPVTTPQSGQSPEKISVPKASCTEWFETEVLARVWLNTVAVPLPVPTASATEPEPVPQIPAVLV